MAGWVYHGGHGGPDFGCGSAALSSLRLILRVNGVADSRSQSLSGSLWRYFGRLDLILRFLALFLGGTLFFVPGPILLRCAPPGQAIANCRFSIFPIAD